MPVKDPHARIKHKTVGFGQRPRPFGPLAAKCEVPWEVELR
jgi:hypothetical protein